MGSLTEKIPVYFMPGLAASPKIFERIRLPQDTYEFYFLEWLVPKSNHEDLAHYVKRLAQNIKHDNVILIGVSFGGIIVQELSKYLNTKKVIVISSVKNEKEFPKRLRILQLTKAYKLFPSKTVSSIENFNKFAFSKNLKKKTEMYNTYMQMRNDLYLNWSIFQVLHWRSSDSTKEVIHIHGDQDKIFPIKHIKNCIKIEGGTHAMIVTKATKINKILQEII